MTETLAGLAVIVVNYGSSALLESNLAPLTRAAPELITVIVDNRTTHGERDRVSALAAIEGWTALPLDENRGFGGGMNAGVTRAFELGATELLLLNPDALIEPEALATLLAVVRANPLAMVAPRILTPTGRVWFAGSDLYMDDGTVRSVARRTPGARVEPWLTGACLLLSRTLWQKVGGFDEEYFLYWEDIDLSWRVRAAGGVLEVVEAATAMHDQGGTQQSHGDAKSAVYYYYNVRNRLLFASRFLAAEDRRKWRRSTVRASWAILLRGGRRQLLHPRSSLVPTIRGICDGLRMLRRSRRVSSGVEDPPQS